MPIYLICLLLDIFVHFHNALLNLLIYSSFVKSKNFQMVLHQICKYCIKTVFSQAGQLQSFRGNYENVDDRDWEVISRLTKELYGKLFADRGYMSQKMFEKLFEQNIQLITRLKSNMKNKLVNFSERLLLRKRAVIESVNDFLKSICQIEHSRYRSVDNFFVNLLAALVAYSFIPKKPSLNILKFPASV